MKRPVRLSFAIALALAGGNAFALGLGTIQVKSGLNQPLDAEIPVLADSPAEANALTVDLASAADFERIGLSRSRLGMPIDMAIGTNARGQTVVKLTTKDPVREPLLDFLLVANWPKGKLLREFTILLDPPVTAPVARTAPATVAPVAERPSAAPQPLVERKAPPPKPARPEPKPPVAAAPRTAPPPAPAPEPKAPSHAAGANDYGPVAAGETLSEIARATRPDEKTNIDQMMLALLKANPKAFYQDNINALRRGAILRIPSGDELRANGTARAAAETVHAQNDSWTGKVPVAAPTLVARTGTPAAKGSSAASAKNEPAAKQERLALVPPTAGKSSATTDRAGSAGGTGKDSAELKSELARTREALTSREQEASELKSRVKQLEDIGSKDQRLISMKDSEIADLQKKLKDLQARASATTAAAAARTQTAAVKPPEPAAGKTPEPTAGRPEQKITAKDIWGDLNASEKPAAKPGSTTTPATAATTTAATATTTPTTTTPTTTTAPGTPTTATAPATAATTPPAATAAPSATTAPPSTAASAPSPEPAAQPASSTAGSAATSATPSPSTSPSVTAVKPSPAVKVTPLETQAPAEPFWRNQNVLLGGGAALVLIGLLALMRFMRKPKPAFAGAALDDGGMIAEADDEELRLRDALQQNPANTAASLELLRYYYARGDAAKFEAAAETMHAHLADPNAPEWDEVLAMGAALAPNHPLFSGVAGEAPMYEPALDREHAATHEFEEEFTYPEHGHEELAHEAGAAAEDFDAARTHVGPFDFEPAPVGQTHETAPAPAHDPSFDFDLPAHAEEPPTVTAHEGEPEPVFTQVPEPAMPPRNDDIYVGEDAIGTKLDLAKAYLDMGDPEGARSMLDEVMSEGNDTQKDEARRLLAEIR